MSAYVIFDVEIRDMTQYQEFVKGVKPAIDAAGGALLSKRRSAQGLRGRLDATANHRP